MIGPQGGAHPGNGVGESKRLPGLNLLLGVRNDLEHCQGLLGLLIGMYIHEDGPGFPILGDHDGFAVLPELVQYLGRVRLDKTDGFDLGRKPDDAPPEPNIVR